VEKYLLAIKGKLTAECDSHHSIVAKIFYCSMSPRTKILKELVNFKFSVKLLVWS